MLSQMSSRHSLPFHASKNQSRRLCPTQLAVNWGCPSFCGSKHQLSSKTRSLNSPFKRNSSTWHVHLTLLETACVKLIWCSTSQCWQPAAVGHKWMHPQALASSLSPNCHVPCTPICSCGSNKHTCEMTTWSHSERCCVQQYVQQCIINTLASRSLFPLPVSI